MQTGSKHTRKRIETALAKAGVTSWDGGTVTAYVNHGRWVADCPCNGAELVTPGHTMLCGSCGGEHKVVFPKHARQVEAALRPRDPQNRNWLPHETIDDLTAENIDNGILPDDFRGA